MPYIQSKQKPSKGQVLGEALRCAQQILELTKKDLSEIIHTSESTITRYKNGAEIEPTSAEGQFALYFIRIFRSLDTIVGGNDNHAIDWLKSYNEHLSDKPINLIKSINGIQVVLNYLENKEVFCF